MRCKRIAGLPWPALALLALAVATFVGFLVYPTYPNYDSYYSLLWGREVLHGPAAELRRLPLADRASAGGRLRRGAVAAGPRRRPRHGLLHRGVVRRALPPGSTGWRRLAFTPLVGLAAAGILCTRFDFPFLAARAYIDIPYLAFVIWAAAFELARPRRGGSSGCCWPAPACCARRRG